MSRVDPILRGPVLAGPPRRLELTRVAAGMHPVPGTARPWPASREPTGDAHAQAQTHAQAQAQAQGATTDAVRTVPPGPAAHAGHVAGHVDGHAEGYAAGHAQGLAEARAAAAAAAEEAKAAQRAALARIEQAAADAERRAEVERSHARNAEARVRDVAVQAARLAWNERLEALERAAGAASWTALCRLLGEQLSRRDVLQGLVAQTLREAAAALPTRVRLHPADLALLRAEGSVPDDTFEWVADPALAPGSCEVDATRGTWAADLDLQLQTLRDLWRGHVA